MPDAAPSEFRTVPPSPGDTFPTLAPEPPEVPPPVTVPAPPGYEILREIDRGAMGVVYEALPEEYLVFIESPDERSQVEALRLCKDAGLACKAVMS